MASLKSAKDQLAKLGYDPIEALVEIARNRNQISELRLKAAIALLPYAYSQIPTKLDVSITENTGVMVVPVPVTEDNWERQIDKISSLALTNNHLSGQSVHSKGGALQSGNIIDVGPDGRKLN